MGEAKRRKKALGDRYGVTPPVLRPGSEQLEEHTEKFVGAYFTKFENLNKSKPEEDQLENEQETIAPNPQQQKDSKIIAMKQWVQDYFEPYRPKDREQLVMGLLEPFYFVLFEAPPEYFEQETEDGNSEYIASMIAGLTSLSILRSYLSEATLEEYIEPMRSLYWDMLDTLENEESNKEALNRKSEQLTVLFQDCLDEEDLPEHVSPEIIRDRP